MTSFYFSRRINGNEKCAHRNSRIRFWWDFITRKRNIINVKYFYSEHIILIGLSIKTCYKPLAMVVFALLGQSIKKFIPQLYCQPFSTVLSEMFSISAKTYDPSTLHAYFSHPMVHSKITRISNCVCKNMNILVKVILTISWYNFHRFSSCAKNL